MKLMVLLAFLFYSPSMTNVNTKQSQCEPCLCEERRNIKIANCQFAPSLTYIPEGLDQDIKELHFKGQLLNSLEENQFKCYPTLTALYLKNNEIRNVNEGSFKNLSGLTILDLSKNIIYELPPIFRDTPNIIEIYLNNNELRILGDNLFSNLLQLRKIHLQDNKIHSIEDNCFSNIPSIFLINLSSNTIGTLPDTLIGNLSNLKVFELEDNPWICDQETCKFREYALEKNWRISMPHCDYPESVKGKIWSELKNDTVMILANETNVHEGQNVTLICQYTSCIPCKLMWKTNTNEILTYTTSFSENKCTAILNLYNVKSDDVLKYICTVEDYWVRKEKEFYLRVKARNVESFNSDWIIISIIVIIAIISIIVIIAIIAIIAVVLFFRKRSRKYEVAKSEEAMPLYHDLPQNTASPAESENVTILSKDS